MQLPSGQYYSKKWVIYSALGNAQVDIQKWRLKIGGLVEKDLEFTYSELQDLPQEKMVKDFHCVTKWSIQDVIWEGVSLMDLVNKAAVREEADWVMFHCSDGYTAPVPLEDAMSDDAIVALRMNGQPIKKEQGFPARPFIPHLYGWKSAKWLEEIRLVNGYADGYWEMYGYHERGAVSEEERFNGGSGSHSKRRVFGIFPA